MCITETGTYTVEMTPDERTVTRQVADDRRDAGTQTLVGRAARARSTPSSRRRAGITNGAQGAITLTNADGCGNSVTLVGPITNAGTITTEPAHGGARTLQGNLTNTGTLAINANTAYNGAKARC